MINITAARKANRRIIDINMAPLIDMVFILLIFFLVTTNFVRETGVEVDRPSAVTAVDKSQAAILIGISHDNRIFMKKQEINLRTVQTNVERALAENPDGGVVIVADKKSRTGISINVIDACRAAGAVDVSIAADSAQEN